MNAQATSVSKDCWFPSRDSIFLIIVVYALLPGMECFLKLIQTEDQINGRIDLFDHRGQIECLTRQVVDPARKLPVFCLDFGIEFCRNLQFFSGQPMIKDVFQETMIENLLEGTADRRQEQLLHGVFDTWHSSSIQVMKYIRVGKEQHHLQPGECA